MKDAMRILVLSTKKLDGLMNMVGLVILESIVN